LKGEDIMKLRTFIVATALAAGSIVPGLASPAYARHTCGLDEVDPTVNTVCEHHHAPGLVLYLVCLVLPTC
jgi:hypothetical protein